MQKLWPAYRDEWYPALSKADRTAEINLSQVRKFPLANLEKGTAS